MTVLVVAEAAAILLLGLLVAGLLRSHAEILRQLHQLGAGREERAQEERGEEEPGPEVPVEMRTASSVSAPAHDVAGETPADEAVAVGVVGADHDTVLAFLSSGCLTCADFWEAFRRPQELGLPARSRVVVVTKGPADESVSEVRDLANPAVPVVMSTQAWLDYHVPGAPYFVYVDGASGRVVGEGTGQTWQQVAGLLTRASQDRRAPSRGRPGEEGGGGSRVDQELAAAGIGPGHPSLYPTAVPEQREEE